MRVLAAALLVAGACFLASSASALNLPPIGLGSIHALKLSHHDRGLRSCDAKSRSRLRAAKAARKLNPVACEQPPRSRVLDAGFVIVFAP